MSQIEATKRKEQDRKALSMLWTIVGLFGFYVALASFVRQTGAVPPFDAIGFARMDPYAHTVIAIPLISVTGIILGWIGYAHARIWPARSWNEKIPGLHFLPEYLQGSSIERRLKVVFVAAFLVVPAIVVLVDLGKFFSATFYYAVEPRARCKDDKDNAARCARMEPGINSHFSPQRGYSWDRYRFEDGIDYVPGFQPAVYVMLVIFQFSALGCIGAALIKRQ